ncbi:MAG: prepilin-type N-terminal cleavage/methylation domain-containing protein [Gammaproteobacteria bacterium]|nr:prepilin-type N-terminal cleavage/methylation domain-containing protein [Gammaproteobacteria bacterium]
MHTRHKTRQQTGHQMVSRMEYQDSKCNPVIRKTSTALNSGFDNIDHGFSILELLLTLTLIGIALSMALPGFNHLTTELRASTSANLLKSSIKFARSEAITRRVSVRLCPSQNGRDCNLSNQWEKGWIVYLDLTGASARTTNDPILRVYGPTRRISIRKNGRYPTVSINTTGQISLNRSFYFCSLSDQVPLKRLTLIHSGQIRLSNTDISCP